jgi:hypothetical protein
VIVVDSFEVLDGVDQASSRSQPPTIIRASVDAQTSPDIVKYLSENQGSSIVPPPPADEAGYQAQCIDEWTKRGVVDRGMVNYCVGSERDGHAKLAQLLQKYGGYSWMPGVLAKNVNNWTKRGARKDSLVAYGVGREVDAFLNLQYLAQHDAGIETGAANSCLEKWSAGSVQWAMVEYCYKHMTGTD